MNTPQRKMLGHSPSFCSLMRTAELLAPTDATVLIHGESGTGKELMARHIHQRSRRTRAAWVSINCAALPENLAESELFGHSKGAFTGAQERRTGRVQAASGGTLFLDEISELPLTIQPKLLRLLEYGECQVVGQSHTSQADVRVITATNRDLAELVRQGQFRKDLFYRLNVVPLELPPLRDRRSDISLLTQTFLEDFSQRHRSPPPRLDEKVFPAFLEYPWPGNIRELRNLCERLSILYAGRTVELDDLPEEMISREKGFFHHPSPVFSLPDGGICLADLEQSLIKQALAKASGNKSRAARLLGLSRDTFLYRLKKEYH